MCARVKGASAVSICMFVLLKIPRKRSSAMLFIKLARDWNKNICIQPKIDWDFLWN